MDSLLCYILHNIKIKLFCTIIGCALVLSAYQEVIKIEALPPLKTV